MEWKSYPKDRKVARHPSGFIVIVPTDVEPPIPMYCTICSYVMRSHDDEVAYIEFGCCNRCAMLWAQSRKQEWKEGWRPSAGQVASAEAERLPLTVTLDID